MEDRGTGLVSCGTHNTSWLVSSDRVDVAQHSSVVKKKWSTGYILTRECLWALEIVCMVILDWVETHATDRGDYAVGFSIWEIVTNSID